MGGWSGCVGWAHGQFWVRKQRLRTVEDVCVCVFGAEFGSVLARFREWNGRRNSKSVEKITNAARHWVHRCVGM